MGISPIFNEYNGFINKGFIYLLDELYVEANDYDMICFLLGDGQ